MSRAVTAGGIFRKAIAATGSIFWKAVASGGIFRKAIAVARGIFCQEVCKVRVCMGYLLGLASLAGGLNAFLRYVAASGEDANVLEAFIVTEHTGSVFQCLLLGYLLIIAPAPFVRADTCLVLYRSSRRGWNAGALLYILLQSFLYVLFLAGASAVVSYSVGFFGEAWSGSVRMLTLDESGALSQRYKVTFHCVGMVKNMTVPQAFGITFLYLTAYFVLLGVIYYLCNLVFKGFWGLIAVATVHLGSYFLPNQPIPRPYPGYFADGGNGLWMPLCRYLIFAMILIVISFWAVKRVDMPSRAEDEV